MKFMTAKELYESKPRAVTWVCKPWLALEAITELDGKAKSAGKTTFALAMSKAILTGDDFLGEQTVQGRIVYLTEESTSTFLTALNRAGIDQSEDLHILFWKETHEAWGHSSVWDRTVEEAMLYAKEVNASVLIIDTFAQFARLTGDKENSSGAMLELAVPLQKARDSGIAVLLIRHDRKSGGNVAESGRGSSALSGVVDIVLQLHNPEGRQSPNHRKLEALSRFNETPKELTISLLEGEYQVLGETDAVAVPAAAKKIVAILPSIRSEAFTLADIRDATRAPRTTIQAAISDLESKGIVSKSGTGKKRDPHCYYLNAAATQIPVSGVSAECGEKMGSFPSN